jgi:polyphosphate kinase
LKLIQRETAHAKAGRPGRIIAKINSLTDLDVIRALSEGNCLDGLFKG